MEVSKDKISLIKLFKNLNIYNNKVKVKDKEADNIHNCFFFTPLDI
jgi:hypothetical protein